MKVVFLYLPFRKIDLLVRPWENIFTDKMIVLVRPKR